VSNADWSQQTANPSAPRLQLAPPREATTEDDAETGPQTDPNRVARESEEHGTDSSTEDQTYPSGNGSSGLPVLLVNHAAHPTGLQTDGACRCLRHRCGRSHDPRISAAMRVEARGRQRNHTQAVGDSPVTTSLEDADVLQCQVSVWRREGSMRTPRGLLRMPDLCGRCSNWQEPALCTSHRAVSKPGSESATSSLSGMNRGSDGS